MAAAPHTTRRLRTLLAPARGFRLPVAGVVHGDLNLTTILARRDAITGVVDWDDMGLGSRAVDPTGLLFDWQRLRLVGGDLATPDGGERLARRIVEIAGEQGLRCIVTYHAIARLALSAQRRDATNSRHGGKPQRQSWTVWSK